MAAQRHGLEEDGLLAQNGLHYTIDSQLFTECVNCQENVWKSECEPGISGEVENTSLHFWYEKLNLHWRSSENDVAKFIHPPNDVICQNDFISFSPFSLLTSPVLLDSFLCRKWCFQTAERCFELKVGCLGICLSQWEAAYSMSHSHWLTPHPIKGFLWDLSRLSLKRDLLFDC